jgi:probable addiction module antidote protein
MKVALRTVRVFRDARGREPFTEWLDNQDRTGQGVLAGIPGGEGMKAKPAEPYRTLDEVAAEQMRGDPEFALYHLEQCAQDPEPRVFLRALKQLVDAQPGGLTAVARTIGVDRSGLHRALTGAHAPNWHTVARVLRALGVRVQFRPGTANEPEAGRRARG